MLDFLFYLFAALTVLASLLVVVDRNAVNAAMFMIVSFVGMASLFVLLNAYFLAILQILVYAGAVMVLFLFIIMLLDVEVASRKRIDKISFAASCIALALLVAGTVALFTGGDLSLGGGFPEVGTDPTGEAPMAFTTAARSFGYGLFTKYLLPFEVTGFLLLIAMVGVIVLSKKLPTPAKGDNSTETAKAE